MATDDKPEEKPKTLGDLWQPNVTQKKVIVIGAVGGFGLLALMFFGGRAYGRQRFDEGHAEGFGDGLAKRHRIAEEVKKEHAAKGDEEDGD